MPLPTPRDSPGVNRYKLLQEKGVFHTAAHCTVAAFVLFLCCSIVEMLYC